MVIYGKVFGDLLRKKPKRTKNTFGFTLIELLIVLVLIGMFVGLVGANYMTSLRRGRDARRREDMKKVQQAFEQYYGANQTYNATCSNMAIPTYYVGSYPPTSPPGAAAYTISCTASTYCACGRMEVDKTGNSIDNACNYTGAGDKNFFCTSNLQ